MRESVNSALSVILALLAVASMVSGAAGLMTPPEPVEESHSGHSHNHESPDVLVGVSPVGTAEASHKCGQSIALNLGLRSDLTTAQQAANVLGSCNPLHGDRSNETIDHNQTQTELIQRGATANEQSRVFLDSVTNNLDNTRAVARLEAQGEYYRQLESGASESAARLAAKDAVRDYYTVKQMQLASSWNILIKSWDSYEITASAEGLGNFVGVNRENGGNKTDISIGAYKHPTLINGSSDQEIAELHYDGNTYQVSPMSWSTLALSSTSGVDPPDDLDGIASMTVAHGGSTHEGILLADTEAVTQIEVNTTYNGSNWAVTPQVVTDSSYVKLDGTFTVTEIKTADGSTVQNRTYREVDYKTTNTTEYRQLMGELDTLRTELEAREANSGGGGLFGGLPGFGGLPDSALLIGGAVLLGLLLLKD